MSRRFSACLTTCGLTLALASPGCSTFHQEWEKASADLSPASDMTGRWEGSWVSDVNGHDGRLRCLLTKLDDGCYRAHYKANYWRIFRVSYSVKMKATREPEGSFNFQGEADLGWWGGVFHYDGHATPTKFFSTYKSKYDHGTFQMTRPQPAMH